MAQPACENEANPHNIILNTCGTEDILSNNRAHEKMGFVEKTSKHPSIIDSIFQCYMPEPPPVRL